MKKVKRKKLSIKKTLRIILPLLLITILLINSNNILMLYESKITGYQKETIEVFHELNIYKDIKNHDYSNTLEKIIKTEYYNKKYLNNYLDIEYNNNPDFLKNINLLLSLGYDTKEINTIYKNLSPDSINILIENNYLKDITNIINLNYFHEDNLKRYLTYQKDKNIDYIDLITYVNIGLDKEYYTEVTNIKDPTDINILVNKYHALDSNYIPSDLEAIDNKYNRGGNNKLRHVAKIAFEKMCADALKDNIKIYSGSAYRSYNYQLNLYNRYVKQNGFKNAETFSARAGYSEHQTGLATDILNEKLNYISSSDKEYDWLVNNSYKYGFILRYPKGKENITGYMYEEWHFRYLDPKIAEDLHKLSITYDEYVARK